jgi:hypothetical protein
MTLRQSWLLLQQIVLPLGSFPSVLIFSRTIRPLGPRDIMNSAHREGFITLIFANAFFWRHYQNSRLWMILTDMTKNRAARKT